MKLAIRRVSSYTATPVETCDRCSAGIKYVFVVFYADGLTEKYGSECINKILNGDTSLKSLFNKNVKKLKGYKLSLDVLSRPEGEMPRGREYFDSGLYFIGNGEGKDIFGGHDRAPHWFFHPLYDVEKNHSGGRYVVTDDAKRLADSRREIEAGKVWFTKEVARIEIFLARVLHKAQQQQQQQQQQQLTQEVA